MITFSNLPKIRIIPQFGWMAYSRCTPEEKTKMFGTNMQRILKRVKF